MANSIHDQAEGLRRLLVHEVQDFMRIVVIASGSAGAGKTTAVINLAAALARDGKDVLVIDENVGASNLSSTLGLTVHRDLLDVMRRDMTLDDVIVAAPEGFHFLSAGRGMRVLGKLGLDDQAHLLDCFARFDRPVDVVLVDALAGRASRSLPLNFSSHEVVVVVSPEPTSITAAYGLIKHISSGQGKKRFRILVNKARDETEARMIFDNIASAANRYLAVSAGFMGFVPPDEKLRQSASRGRPVIESFPAAASAAAFHRLAESLTRWPCDKSEDNSESRGLKGFMQCLMQGSRGSHTNVAPPGVRGLRGSQISHV